MSEARLPLALYEGYCNMSLLHLSCTSDRRCKTSIGVVRKTWEQAVGKIAASERIWLATQEKYRRPQCGKVPTNLGALPSPLLPVWLKAWPAGK